MMAPMRLQLWDLDHPDSLPHEIIGMLQVTDPNYLGLVFNGVKNWSTDQQKG